MLELLGKILAILGYGALVVYIALAMCGVSLIPTAGQQVAFLVGAGIVAVVGSALYICNPPPDQWDYYS